MPDEPSPQYQMPQPLDRPLGVSSLQALGSPSPTMELPPEPWRKRTGRKIKFFLTPGQRNTWDVPFLVWLVIVAEFIYKTWTGPTFDSVTFGTGAAALLGTAGALQWRANLDGE